MEGLSPAAILLGLATLGHAASLVEALCLRRVRRRTLPPAASTPGCSFLKPLALLDDELERNLESHLEQDYDGPWELVLGVGSGDPALPVARAFAQRHPERVRLLVDAADPTAVNPKIARLIALTARARHPVLVCTDAGVRVPPGHLREVVAALARPGVGIATHVVAGVGERRLGAVWDNQALVGFVAPNVGVAATLMPMDQVVGKAFALSRTTLARLGGWEAVAGVLGEDKQLGDRLGPAGLRSFVCPTPIEEVRVQRTLGDFWARHTRWAAIRFHVLRPGVFLEPLLNPTAFVTAALGCSPRSRGVRLAAAASWAASVAYIQVCARLTGRPPFSALHAVLYPVQQLGFLAVWLRGATLREVRWHRGRWRLVGRRARLERVV